MLKLLSIFSFLLLYAYGCTDLKGNQTPAKESPAEHIEIEPSDASGLENSLSIENKAISEHSTTNQQKTVGSPKSPVTSHQSPAAFSIEYLMGKFEPKNHPDFVPVDKKYSDGDEYFLRKETYEAFQQMWAAAQADGVNLTIISATRNFNRQKSIWEAKWTGARLIENGTNAEKKYPDPKTRALKILEYSSMPGSSRHHWGTDIDLNNLDNFSFEQGPGKKVYEWLTAHAAEFGFCQPYSAKGTARPNGYNEEKWHWSYIPVARKLTDLAARQLKDEMIGGFQGAASAVEIGIVEKYVLGINKACL